MIEFFPNGFMSYLYGGLLIGIGISLVYFFNGYVAGSSSFFSSTLSYISNKKYFLNLKSQRTWRLLFAIGTILGGFFFMLSTNSQINVSFNIWRLIIGGIIVGIGARMADGCTSGHGVCGVASMNVSSIISVIIFLLIAIITANILRFIGVGM